MAGLDMVHILLGGDTPAITELLGGRVSVYLGLVALPTPQVKAGRLRALAVSGSTRLLRCRRCRRWRRRPAGYSVSGWFGARRRRHAAADPRAPERGGGEGGGDARRARAPAGERRRSGQPQHCRIPQDHCRQPGAVQGHQKRANIPRQLQKYLFHFYLGPRHHVLPLRDFGADQRRELLPGWSAGSPPSWMIRAEISGL